MVTKKPEEKLVLAFYPELPDGEAGFTECF